MNNTKIQLPSKKGKIDFDFIETFVAELQSVEIIELETKNKVALEAYLLATGLNDYILTEKEKEVLEAFRNNENSDGGGGN